MCGIIGILSKKPVIKELRQGLIGITYRGYDSAGVAVIDNGRIVLNKDVGYIENLKVDESLQGTIGIGHTRWATHGEVTKENAHPFLDCSGGIAVVHNGIIENYEILKEDMRWHNFSSQTDSEVIAHLIENGMEMGFERAFKVAVDALKGSYAIVAIHKDYPFIMVARRDSPLLIGKSRDKVYVASDVQAFGEDVANIAEVEDNSVMKLSLDTEIKSEMGNSFNVTNKEGYEHYMLKEIQGQPDTLVGALKQDRNKLVGVSLDVMRAGNIILTACGTSRFASIVGRYLMLRLGKRMSETIVGSELHYFVDSFSDNTLIIAVSQSGETADVLTGIRLAKKQGSRIISIVNRQYSSLERLSDVTLFMNCGAEIAVASTKAFTNELIIFYLLAFTMANKYEEGLKELRELPQKVKDCLIQSDNVERVAKIIKDVSHIYYVGKGINFAVAGECALKLKEVSYIHAESMSAGELKHGTLSLIEKGTPVIGLCPDDYTYQEVIANLHEAKARGGLIIGISDKNNSVFDHWFPIPKVKDIYYPLVSVIIGQLLAYFVAVEKGLNPDRPRNLAKSVTV
jgi:glucosamine--fructose-6-phosphate aminotransferase (isomerizing)